MIQKLKINKEKKICYFQNKLKINRKIFIIYKIFYHKMKKMFYCYKNNIMN